MVNVLTDYPRYLWNKFGEHTKDYKGNLTDEDIDEAKRTALESKRKNPSDFNPLDRQLEQVGFDAYKSDPRYAFLYDKFVAPFKAGSGSVKAEDLVRPRYKQFGIDDTEADAKRKSQYNKRMARWSAADPLIQKGAAGLGSIAATALHNSSIGGLPGVLGAAGIHGAVTVAPYIWRKVKELIAGRGQDKKRDNAAEYYRQLLEKHSPYRNARI
jgi:hypothetical protein